MVANGLCAVCYALRGATDGPLKGGAEEALMRCGLRVDNKNDAMANVQHAHIANSTRSAREKRTTVVGATSNEQMSGKLEHWKQWKVIQIED